MSPSLGDDLLGSFDSLAAYGQQFIDDIDEERAPLLRLAWNLYATGDYTLERLQATMADHGLMTRATGHRPLQPVSLNKFLQMLRDPYYLGLVRYNGETFEGRHEALIGRELFERVQEVLDQRSRRGQRDRVLTHFLKGMLFCDRCRQAGKTSRLIYTEATGRGGLRYQYFLCRGRQDKLCDLPHLAAWQVEDAIERHISTVQLPESFLSRLRDFVTETVDDEQRTVRQLHSSVTAQIAKLDVQEERLLDLATDDALPKAKIRTRLRKITDQRSSAQASLVDSTAQLALGGDLLRRYLELVTDPVKLYARLPDSGRRLLNQAFFDQLYLDEERVQHDVKTPELAQLQAVQRHDAAWTGARALARNQRAPDQPARGVTGTMIDLLGSIELVDVSSKAVMVGALGLEPRTNQL